MKQLWKYTTSAYDILSRAMNEHEPTAIVAMTSGGHDSQACTQVVYEWCQAHGLDSIFHAVAMDTGVTADGWREWITQHSTWPNFKVWSNPDVGFQWYADNAIAHGFGYTRAMHDMMYFRMLKERTAAKLLKAHKDHSDRTNRVMFTWGIFASESNERRDAPDINRRGAAVNVNPILHWNKEVIAAYRLSRDLPANPFYDTVGGSGDCQCNWGQFITLDELYKHSPKLALKLAILSREVKKIHGWGWGEEPSAGLLAERAGQLVLPGVEPLAPEEQCIPNICAGCKRQKPGHNEAMENVLAQRMTWGDDAA